jgi:hypothetical protein
MVKTIALFVAGLILGGILTGLWTRARADAPRLDTPFQAILLDSGQVYYGKLSGLGTDYPLLRNVYYVQTTTDQETKQVNNILIRRGNEWHGPESTLLNARHIVLVEPVGQNSKVAQLIAEQEKHK